VRCESRPLVLVVEDDQDNLDSIVELLHDEGYDTLAARTGQQALTCCRGVDDLCLMIVDYGQPRPRLPVAVGTADIRPGTRKGG
jgi:CheY-like chemotaxis protein